MACSKDDDWQPSGLGIVPRVFHGFSEEARTSGFPSPPFGGFGFVGYEELLCWNGKIASIRRLRSKEFLLKVESGRISLQAIARDSLSALQSGATL